MPWRVFRNRAQILAVHAAYMHWNQILYFGGDQYDAAQNQQHLFHATRLFDCSSFAVKTIPSPEFDAFCSGHAFLFAANEAKLLVAGGTEQHYLPAGPHLHHYPGLRDAAIFSSPNAVNPAAGGWKWAEAAQMNLGLVVGPEPEATIPNPNPQLTGGRWYPTLLTLPNGDVIAFSGHPGSSDCYHTNDIPEVYSRTPEPKGQWTRLAPYGDPQAHAYYKHDEHRMPGYPRVHLLPSGDILCTNVLSRQTVSFLPNVGPWGGTFKRVCMFPPGAVGDYQAYFGYGFTSVLLPLRPLGPADDYTASYLNPAHPHYKADHARCKMATEHRARVMICGGASQTPYLLDLKGWHPTASGNWGWQPTGPRPMSKRRLHANSTILPTGEILVTGGIDVAPGVEWPPDTLGVREPEIYDPYTDTWKPVPEPEPTPRNYHSVALLMPDGRVWCAGSSRNSKPGLDTRNLDITIFEPWYHGDPERPHITQAPSLFYPGQTVLLKTTFADEIDRVVMVRCGSCTHAFNSDQRLIELCFRHPVDDILLVDTPPNNFILPPGPYLFYTIRKKPGTLGLPSYGANVYVVPG